MVFLALSVLMTASVVPFWDAVVVSGAHVWVYSPTPVSVKIHVGVLAPLVFIIMLIIMWCIFAAYAAKWGSVDNREGRYAHARGIRDWPV